jgi:hypothetical protein
MDAGKVLLMAAGGQVLLTIGQLRVVRRYFGGLPTFLFALDSASNVLSLLAIFYKVNLSGASVALGSFAKVMSTGDMLLNIGALVVFVIVGYWIAVTPERLIDTGGDE